MSGHGQLLFLMSSMFVFGAAYPELLIIKHGENGLCPLTLQDIQGHEKKLSGILDKFQWPMCIASELSENEMDILLTPSAAHASSEEKFIEQKINEEFAGKLQCSVVFIPTVIYELFCIGHGLTQRSSDPFFVVMQNVIGDRIPDWKIDITKIINLDENPTLTWKKFFEVYQRINSLVAGARFYINQILAQELFKIYPQCANFRSSEELSDFIERISPAFGQPLINKICGVDHVYLFRDGLDDSIYRFMSREINSQTRNRIDEFKKSFRGDIVIPRVIALEYEAKKENKALLLRGTSFEEFQVGIEITPTKKVLAGSTLHKYEQEVDEEALESKPVSFERAYGEGTNRPYSISLNNSLFPGFFRDPTACTYFFLKGSRVGGNTPEQKNPGVGYAILIDKKAYKQHRCHRLFFISPLATIAALAQNGEHFHSRTTAAIIEKEDKEYSVSGMSGSRIKDPTGVFLITRDPLRHAEIFSKFLADNGRFIQSGNMNTLTVNERIFVEKIQRAQREAAELYKKDRLIFQTVRKGVEEYKKRKGIPLAKTEAKKQQRLVRAFNEALKRSDALELERIINSGLNPNTIIDGKPIVLLIIKQKLANIACLLIARGAKPNTMFRGKSILRASISRYEQAFQSEEKQLIDVFIKIIQALVAHGANVNEPPDRRSAMAMSIMGNLLDVTKVLLTGKDAYYTEIDEKLCESPEMLKILQDNIARKRP